MIKDKGELLAITAGYEDIINNYPEDEIQAYWSYWNDR